MVLAARTIKCQERNREPNPHRAGEWRHTTRFTPSRSAIQVQPLEISRKMDRQSLLLLHLPQVRLVAKGIWDRMRFAVELDDLIGYGTIGLVHAVERFDPARGILLKTYAEHRIRGAILDGLRGMDWLPRSARRKEREKRQQPLEEVSGTIPPTSSMTVTNPGEHYFPRIESVFPGGSLGDLEALAESAHSWSELGAGGNNPECLYEHKEELDQLRAAVLRLPRRHRQILDYYYRQEMRMRQIGVVLKIHESRVSQLHAAAVTRLRKDLSTRSASASGCRKPPERYSPDLPGFDSSNRLTAIQSSSVSTPMVS